MTRERPILFQGAMVRALLSGAKTQTRRVLRDQSPVDLALAAGEKYHMLTEEPEHCAESMLSVLESLWRARTELNKRTTSKGGA